MLYSFQKNSTKSAGVAEKELLHSLTHTYNLYHLFLLLITDLTFFASKKIDAGKNKLRPTEDEINPNLRFVENKFAKQVSENLQLKEYLKENKISWVNYPTVTKSLYEIILKSDFYIEYMEKEEVSYEDDKELWRKIFKRCIPQSEELESALEEESIYWNDDIEIVLSFVMKTVKRFEESQAEKQELLPMFRDEDDKAFGLSLFRNAIEKADEYKALIDKYTQNWEIDRIAFMDIVIMQVAIAELLTFPTIPVNVTLNEFIEIAKTYSTNKSNSFINGVLDNIVNQLKKEKKLIKAKIV